MRAGGQGQGPGTGGGARDGDRGRDRGGGRGRGRDRGRRRGWSLDQGLVMKVVIVAGGQGVGKTAVLLHLLRHAQKAGLKAGVFKIDALDAGDELVFIQAGFAAKGHSAKDVCPDHEAMVSLGRAWDWAEDLGLDLLCIETAGLCHRCSPFLKRALAICVVSGLAHLGTPESMRPIVEASDLIVLTKTSLISPTERHIFTAKLRAIQPQGRVFNVDGLTGEGVGDLAAMVLDSRDIRFMDIEPLRVTLPMGYCHFCQGIGSGHER